MSVLAAFILGAASCSRLQPGDDPLPVVVLFQNQSLDQADVYVSRGVGDSRRIGTVQAGRTETLVVPQEIVTAGTMNIFVRLLARSIVPRSGAVAVSPGDRLQVTLPSDQRQLTVLPAPQQ